MARADDLRLLGEQVAAAAVILANGEICWPTDNGEAAINALADAGFVILGLDMREYDDEGRFFERPLSSYDPEGPFDVEAARHAALLAFRHGRDLGSRVLITWARPDRR